MKYIKQFESKLNPTEGDFVICTTKKGSMNSPHMEPYQPPSMEDFFKNNIGKITRIEYGFVKDGLGQDTPNIRISFKNVPEDLRRNFYGWQNNKNSYSDGCFVWISNENIKHISKTKSELEMMISAEKYNL